MKKERNSNIELLRIISMLLIILYHIFRRYSGDYEGNFSTLPLHVYLTQTMLGIWGLLGVDIFVAISAWFLCTSRFRLKHIISIVFHTFCYVAVFSVIETAIQYNGIASVLKYSLKRIHEIYVYKNAHWFVAPYLMMCFMSPSMNLLVEKFSKEQMKVLLCVLTGLFVYVQFSGAFFSQSSTFLYIYFVCAYLKKYHPEKHPYMLWGCFLTLIILVSCILNDNSGTQGLLASINNYTSRIFGNYTDRSLIVALTAVCYLMAAVQYEENRSKIINTLGGLTFGVYLFHETFIYIGDESMSLIDMVYRKLVALMWINPDSHWYFAEVLLLTAAIFFAGSAIEFLRKMILHEPVMKLVDRIDFSPIDNWINMK